METRNWDLPSRRLTRMGAAFTENFLNLLHGDLSFSQLHHIVVIFLLHFLLSNCPTALTQEPPPPLPPPPPPRNNASFSALFVLGDSTVDPGNNNYLATILRCNFQPYGIDFIDHVPTGRFCNGKLVTDFIGGKEEVVKGVEVNLETNLPICTVTSRSFVVFSSKGMLRTGGIKEAIPPYLDPTLSREELLTGVSFACAGTGYDSLTATILNVISVPQQLQLMRQYLARIESMVGETTAANVIKDAVFVLSAGTNDFLVNYFSFPLRRFAFTVDQYQNFLIDQLLAILEGLYRLGARRFIVAGVSPLGCLPVEMSINLADAMLRNCIESLNLVATSYNLKLENSLREFKQNGFSGVKVAYADTYNPMLEMIQHPNKYGFQEVKRGCCGTGLIEMGYSCNPYTPICSDRSSYLFWDAIHPTQKTYSILFNAMISDIMTELT